MKYAEGKTRLAGLHKRMAGLRAKMRKVRDSMPPPSRCPTTRSRPRTAT